MSGIPLGATFDDSITADGDTVKFSVTYNGQTATQTTTNISSWYGATMHFQVGDYQQDVPGAASGDGGRVTFSALCRYGVPGGAATGGDCGSAPGGGGSYPAGNHQLVVQNSKLCVDVAGGSTANSAAIDQAACAASNTSQKFQFLPVSGGYGELQNQHSSSDIVIRAAATANGAKAIQYTQNGTSNGLWLPVKQADGTWQFKNKNSGLCLDQTRAVSTAGVQFEQWTCKSGAGSNQDFATQ